MGWTDFALLVRLKKEGYVLSNTAIVEIGAQQLANDVLRNESKLEELREAFERPDLPKLPKVRESVVIHGAIEHLDQEAPRAREIWQWLGFEYASLDVDGSPGSIPMDLNYDEVADDLHKHFHLVTNYGTTEHIANQLHAFKVIHDLTALGGVMVHHLPAQGFLNHGLVNYNPKFFWMLARSNGYKWLYSNFEMFDRPYGLPDNIRDSVQPSEADIDLRARDYRVTDCGLVVAVQKTFDIEYVPPLDVPTGAMVSDSQLRKRYWTVFDPDAFEKLR